MKNCRIDAQCRDHTTWGKTFCVRDHYYQLWDLERNFGEKTLCAAHKNPDLDVNIFLTQGLEAPGVARMGNEEWEDNLDPRTSQIRGFNVGSDTVKGNRRFLEGSKILYKIRPLNDFSTWRSSYHLKT